MLQNNSIRCKSFISNWIAFIHFINC